MAHKDRRAAAALTTVGGGVASVLVGGATIDLVRDDLHILCAVESPGLGGQSSWMCADGIGYLWIAAVFGVMLLFSVVAGSLSASLMAPRPARATLVALAATATAWILGWTWYLSSAHVMAVPYGQSPTDYWITAMLPATVACALAIALAVLGIFVTATTARVALIVGAIGLIVATALQPGLAINTLVGAGLLVAGALRP